MSKRNRLRRARAVGLVGLLALSGCGLFRGDGSPWRNFVDPRTVTEYTELVPDERPTPLVDFPNCTGVFFAEVGVPPLQSAYGFPVELLGLFSYLYPPTLTECSVHVYFSTDDPATAGPWLNGAAGNWRTIVMVHPPVANLADESFEQRTASAFFAINLRSGQWVRSNWNRLVGGVEGALRAAGSPATVVRRQDVRLPGGERATLVHSREPESKSEQLLLLAPVAYPHDDSQLYFGEYAFGPMVIEDPSTGDLLARVMQFLDDNAFITSQLQTNPNFDPTAWLAEKQKPR